MLFKQFKQVLTIARLFKELSTRFELIGIDPSIVERNFLYHSLYILTERPLKHSAPSELGCPLVAPKAPIIHHLAVDIRVRAHTDLAVAGVGDRRDFASSNRPVLFVRLIRV